MKRVAFLALGLGLSSLSFASFDLMLIADNNNVVHRVDPTNGAYLGNFAVSFVPYQMVASYATKRLYAQNGNSISVYDYSTGQLLNVFGGGSFLGGITISSDGNTIYAGNTSAGTINRYTPSGSFLGTFVSGLRTNAMSLATDSSGRLYVTNGANAFCYDASGTLISSSTTPIAAPTASAFSYGGTGFGSALVQANGGASYGYNGVSSGFLATPQTYSFGNMASAQGAVSGHLGAYVLGKDFSTTGLRVTKVEPYPIYPSTSFVMSQITSHRASAIVLAPEPGTWAALGLGALGLVRRRRVKR